MSIKIELKNLGILKQAAFSLGDLTVICGKNNTGKTYVAYALYGFLNSWRGLIDFGVTDAHVQRLLTDGGVKIELIEYIEKWNQFLAEACKRYTDQLDTVLATAEGRSRNSEFHIQTEAIDIRNKEFKREIGISLDKPLTVIKKKGSEALTVALTIEEDQEGEIDPLYYKNRCCLYYRWHHFFRRFAPSLYLLSRTHRGRYFSEGNQLRSETLP